MKANEAEKSKFVYPNKLYARTNDNITLDISYAPQTMEAVEYVRTDSVIEKMQLFLIDKLKEIPMGGGKMKIKADCSLEEFIEDFKKYMEG